MKYRLITLCSFVFLCLSANAQTYEESMRYWDEGPLSWDDLTLKSPRNFRTCDLVFRWATTTQKQKISWNTVQYTPIARVALDKSVSWHNAERIYPCTLAYDQLLFDLNELYFRKTLTELYSEGNKQSANELYSFYSNQSKIRWEEIADDTEDGLDSAMVAFHAARIAEELAQTSYPDMMPTSGQFSLGVGVGMAGSLFLGSAGQTFLPGLGLNVDVSFGYKRHIFTLILSATSGRLAQDYVNGGYTWSSGQSYNHNNVGLLYGYKVYDGPVFSVKPFAGVAGRILSISSKENNRSFTSATAVVGADFFFKFHRTITQNGGFEHSVYLRLFGTRDFSRLQAFSLCFSLGYNWTIL